MDPDTQWTNALTINHNRKKSDYHRGVKAHIHGQDPANASPWVLLLVSQEILRSTKVVSIQHLAVVALTDSLSSTAIHYHLWLVSKICVIPCNERSCRRFSLFNLARYVRLRTGSYVCRILVLAVQSNSNLEKKVVYWIPFRSWMCPRRQGDITCTDCHYLSLNVFARNEQNAQGKKEKPITAARREKIEHTFSRETMFHYLLLPPAMKKIPCFNIFTVKPTSLKCIKNSGYEMLSNVLLPSKKHNYCLPLSSFSHGNYKKEHYFFQESSFPWKPLQTRKKTSTQALVVSHSSRTLWCPYY